MRAVGPGWAPERGPRPLKLAVFTAQLGTVSETFVRRHIEDLLPGETVAVASASGHHFGGRWDPGCPALFLDRQTRGWPARLALRAGASTTEVRARAVAAFLRKHEVTVVLGEYLNQFVEFAPLLSRLGIPFVAQGHGIDLSAALRDAAVAERYGSYASARAILTRCELHRRRLVELGLPSEKVHVNPGGIDLPDEAPQRGEHAAQRLLAVGRMTPKKGPIYLLEAFRLAAAHDPALTLDYVGDGEMMPAVRQFVAACALGSRVTLHGAASEAVKGGLLRECGVFVQHSLTDPETGDEEGLPASIQEAMAHGMAVVSTRHAGIADAIDHGVSGLLAEEGDARGMSELIGLATAPERQQALGAEAAAKARRLYGWPSERQRLLEHLGLAAAAGGS